MFVFLKIYHNYRCAFFLLHEISVGLFSIIWSCNISDDPEAVAPQSIDLQNLGLIDHDLRRVLHVLEIKTATRGLVRNHVQKIVIAPDDQDPDLIFENSSANQKGNPVLVPSQRKVRKIEKMSKNL